MSNFTFPSGFEWSSATAAHQIEGGNWNNDWWAFENAPGTIAAEPSGDACDSYHRYDEDIALLQRLGVSSYRFSVEWSRIQPEATLVSAAELDHYSRVCEALLAVGISPTITLHHFTTPRWLAEQGGWENPETAARFGEFAAIVMARLGDLVGRVCTLNEPNMVASMGYRLGIFPPGRSEDVAAFDAVNRNFVDGHHRAVEAVRAAGDTPVGLTVAMQHNVAGPGGEEQARLADAGEDIYLDAARGSDYVGVQTYTRMVMGPHGWAGPQPGVEVVSTMGYEVWPEALGATVRRAWNHLDGTVPILVTENGIATEDDDQRIRFVSEALRSLHACIADGIDVRGYTYWSLLDNFEWVLGYRPHFGLVAVDRSSFARTLKPSGEWFGRVIAANAVVD